MKRTYQPKKDREKRNTDSERECPARAAEKCLREEDQEEESVCLHKSLEAGV